jgi:homoserine O-succinyltransferase
MREGLTIAILNNMPDAAIRVTEHQFGGLLVEAAGTTGSLRVRWFSMLPREGYEPVGNLWREDAIDGLIVTGTEPRAPLLRQEPYWDTLSATVDWAATGTASVIWSCLAAHATVLRLDDIERRLLPAKLSGVFASTKVEHHPLLANTKPEWKVPHSRFNDLPPLPLISHGYRILTWSEQAGVDIFVKSFRRSLFVFVQSHPEYDARALMREYRRDVSRFLTRQRVQHPDVPVDYFDAQTEGELRLLQQRAIQAPDPEIMDEVRLKAGQAELAAPWRSTAVQFYQNWLGYLGAERAKRDLLQTAP